MDITEAKNNKTYGFKDAAINSVSEDKLGLNRYANAIAEFVEACDTPMTIAIQGAWGSGKSSMLNLIKQSLIDRYETKEENEIPVTIGNIVEINAWEYSQFGIDGNLAIIFLSALVNKISDIKDESALEGKDEGAKRSLVRLAHIIEKGAIIGVDSFIGNKAGDYLSGLLNNLFGDKNEKLEEIPSISDLKKTFQGIIEKKGRTVFFIDDLDRIKPAKAVELLEILKNFLDCEGCIFILAIDYSVVAQGIKEKYGELLDDQKAKQFFDKIIQIPFQMPSGVDKTEIYIKECMKQIGFASNDESKIYNLVLNSVGINPRSIKRLFNLFKLHEIVQEGAHQKTESEQKERARLILFAVICLQTSYNEKYGEMMREVGKEDEQFRDYLDNEEKASLNEHDTFERFMQIFCKCINTYGNQKERYLKKILINSNITDLKQTNSTISKKRIFIKYQVDGAEAKKATFIEGGRVAKGIPALVYLLLINALEAKGKDIISECISSLVTFDRVSDESEKIERFKKYDGEKITYKGILNCSYVKKLAEGLNLSAYIADDESEVKNKEILRFNTDTWTLFLKECGNEGIISYDLAND